MWVAHPWCYHGPAREQTQKCTEMARFWTLLRLLGEERPTLGRVGIATRVNGAAPPDVPLSEINLGSWDFWALDDDMRDGASPRCAARRRSRFTRRSSPRASRAAAGHWALTRYDDVFYASRHPEIFSSALGITIGDQNPELAEYFGSMIAMDDPRHTRLRNIVRSAFTPRVLALIEDSVRDRARRLVAAMIADHPDGTGELVTEFAGPFPLQIICDMMGIPEEDHQQIFHWTNVILGFGDPDIATDFDEFVKVSMDIGAYASRAGRGPPRPPRRRPDDRAWCRPKSTANG